MKRDTMLIFEDNLIECELLAEIFRQDYNILTAANGKEGLELLNRHFSSIAVVLLDHLMPVMDGFQVLDHLQPQKMLRKIPFIMVTGQDSAEFEKKAMNTAW